MEPIKVILVNTDNIFYQILNSPFFSFIVGTVVTIIISFLIQNKSELQNKKDKIVTIHIEINKVIQYYNNLLTYLNPEFNNAPEIIFSNQIFNSEDDFNRAVKNKRKEVIMHSIEEIEKIEDAMMPLIKTYINKKNIKYFESLFTSFHKITNEFLEVPIICKKVYDPIVQTMIVRSTRDTFVKNIEEILEIIYYTETRFINIKYQRWYNKYSSKIDYFVFFNDYEKKGEQYSQMRKAKEI